MGASPDRQQAADPEQLAKLWTDFGHWLTDLRVERGLDRRQLADKAVDGNGRPMSYQTVMTLEQGGRSMAGEWDLPNPKDEILSRIAKVLAIPVERMYERVGRYADRPQTKASRRGQALRQPSRSDDDLWRRLDRIERTQAAIAAKLGVSLDDEDAGEDPAPPPPPRRPRRGGRAG